MLHCYCGLKAWSRHRQLTLTGSADPSFLHATPEDLKLQNFYFWIRCSNRREIDTSPKTFSAKKKKKKSTAKVKNDTSWTKILESCLQVTVRHWLREPCHLVSDKVKNNKQKRLHVFLFCRTMQADRGRKTYVLQKGQLLFKLALNMDLHSPPELKVIDVSSRKSLSSQTSFCRKWQH